MPVAPGAPRCDLTLDEGTRWGFVIFQVEDGTGAAGPRVPFPSGTTAYADIRSRPGGEIIARLGPDGTAFDVDGDTQVIAASGEIRGLFDDAADTVDLPFPGDGTAMIDVFLLPAGVEAHRYRYCWGFIFYPRQITTSPGA